jgi:hypothetical protein
MTINQFQNVLGFTFMFSIDSDRRFTGLSTHAPDKILHYHNKLIGFRPNRWNHKYPNKFITYLNDIYYKKWDGKINYWFITGYDWYMVKEETSILLYLYSVHECMKRHKKLSPNKIVTLFNKYVGNIDGVIGDDASLQFYTDYKMKDILTSYINSHQREIKILTLL